MLTRETKYIFITGGVLSSLGKGITAASVATLLKHSGLNVGILKIDPYINVDPGTMSPLEHGEVFVTEDGGETDLDVGHYERFLDTSFSKKNNFTTGQVYQSVIERERRGEYLGKTIQVIPHITDEIIRRITLAGEGKDILIVELGGTIGDIEGLPFLEAIREIKQTLGLNRVFNIHVTLVPYISAAGELKTKPTQHSVQELRRIGITPQMIIVRCEKHIPKDIKKKIAQSCDVELDSVIEAVDAPSIYQVPLNLLKDKILVPIAKKLELGDLNPNMDEWDMLVKRIIAPKDEVVIAFVGKYYNPNESYKSLIEALIHAGANVDCRVTIRWCDSEEIEDRGVEAVIGDCDAILVPGGFGERGVNGKIKAIEYARVNNIPYLGICLGMQLAIIEYARNVLNLSDATSTEFDKDTKNPLIIMIDEFINNFGEKEIRTSKSPMGATMRLGEYECYIKDGSLLQKAYNNSHKVKERHRHRFEFNNSYKEDLEEAGLIFSGESNGLCEAIELKEHNWFVAVQFHPEFTSRLQNPNGIILEFVKQGLKFSKNG